MAEIIILEIDFNFAGTEDKIYPVVLKDNKSTVLVDCGYIGSLGKIEKALKKKGISPDEITSIIITHHDHDHIGALADFKEKYPQVRIISSKQEAPYISGEVKSLRLIQAEKLQEILPEEQKDFGTRFINILKSVKPVAVDQVVVPNEILDICGGCRILDTKGHTEGHISLLLENRGVLIAGDGAVVKKGELQIANPQFTLDMENAEKSLDTIKISDVETIICYHSGILKR